MRRLLLALSSSLIILSSCAFPGSSGEVSLEQKKAIVGVALDYLRYIIEGRTTPLDGLVVWGDFIPNRGREISKPEILEAILHYKSLQIPLNENPLTQLDLLEVEVDRDDATVELKKTGGGDFPIVKITLLWTGRGWLITHDNLFGEDGIVEQEIAHRGK